MEELLNKLIEKGWKPFGNKKIVDCQTAELNINLLNEEINKVSNFKDKVAFSNGVLIFDEINLRELTSKESGLWQFVCENGMIKGYTRKAYMWQYRDPLGTDWDRTYRKEHYQYRLIESALCDEDKLEQFLLDNIKIGNYEN